MSPVFVRIRPSGTFHPKNQNLTLFQEKNQNLTLLCTISSTYPSTVPICRKNQTLGVEVKSGTKYDQ